MNPRNRSRSFDTEYFDMHQANIGDVDDPMVYGSFLIDANLAEQWDFLKRLANTDRAVLEQRSDYRQDRHMEPVAFGPDIESLLLYISSKFAQINETASGRRPPVEEYVKLIHALDRLFDDIPLTTEPLFVYRCYTSLNLPNYPQNADGELILNSFLSTAVSRDWLTRNHFFCPPGISLMICIHIPVGSRVLPIMDHGSISPFPTQVTEYEIVLDQYGRLRDTGQTHHGVQLYDFIQPSFEERDDLKIALYRRLNETMLWPVDAIAGRRIKKSHRKRNKSARKRKSQRKLLKF